MKTIRKSTIALVALFMTIGFTACKKDADPAPELSAKVVGNYTLTGLRQNGTLYTINAKTTGKMSVTRESATAVGLTMDVTNSSSPADDIHIKATNIALKDTGSGEAELSKDGAAFGKGGNNSLTIRVAPLDGSTPYELIGTK